jgi:hypothetical protein
VKDFTCTLTRCPRACIYLDLPVKIGEHDHSPMPSQPPFLTKVSFIGRDSLVGPGIAGVARLRQSNAG